MGEIDHTSAVQLESAYGQRVFIRGLRLWLTSKNGMGSPSPPQQLWYVDAAPDTVEVNEQHAAQMRQQSSARQFLMMRQNPLFFSTNE